VPKRAVRAVWRRVIRSSLFLLIDESINFTL
jgi:hypothetical protein